MFELEDCFSCRIIKMTERIIARFNFNSMRTLTKWPFRTLAICFESETVLLPSLTCIIVVELGAISSTLCMVLHMFFGMSLFSLIKDW